MSVMVCITDRIFTVAAQQRLQQTRKKRHAAKGNVSS